MTLFSPQNTTEITTAKF